jgi:hypothetical protein
MRLGSGLCLLLIAMATIVQITPRYQIFTVTEDAGPRTFSLTGHVSANTNNWYLHGWIDIYTNTWITYLLAMHQVLDDITMGFYGNLQVLLNSVLVEDINGGGLYILNKWFFVEVGSTDIGHYAKVQSRNGTPYAIPVTAPPFIITANSYIKYPANYALPATHIVRTK